MRRWINVESGLEPVDQSRFQSSGRRIRGQNSYFVNEGLPHYSMSGGVWQLSYGTFESLGFSILGNIFYIFGLRILTNSGSETTAAFDFQINASFTFGNANATYLGYSFGYASSWNPTPSYGSFYPQSHSSTFVINSGFEQEIDLPTSVSSGSIDLFVRIELGNVTYPGSWFDIPSGSHPVATITNWT